MNILIITNYFHPLPIIAAFRLDAFAKYFRSAGHDVTVITYGVENTTSNAFDCDIRYVTDPTARLYPQKCHFRDTSRYIVPRILKALETRLTLNQLHLWCAKATKMARQIISEKRIDLLLTTVGFDMACHICGLRLKTEFPEIFWIADMRDELRDPMMRFKLPLLHQILLKSYRRKMQDTLDKSDLLLSVSAPIVDGLRRSSSHHRALEIRNGYDYPEMYDTCFQKRFTMMYLGNFYLNIHPDSWFQAYTELLDEGRLPKDSLIKIVGNRVPIKIPDAISQNVIEMPVVTHDEAVRMSIEETDVLVMVYSPRKGRRGVYSGKLLDYLATNKPIISIYDHSDVVGELMRDTRAGFAVDEDDIPAIKDALMDCYRLWLEKRTMPRDWEKIKEFRRSHQVGLLLDYLEKEMRDRDTAGKSDMQ
ncbi:MAG: glycosyl transferase [Paramuribaculum sp.]|nr:glycosyl transferase [Paramuribaculum sp.]